MKCHVCGRINQTCVDHSDDPVQNGCSDCLYELLQAEAKPAPKIGTLDLESIGRHAREVLSTALDDWNNDSPSCAPRSVMERLSGEVQLTTLLSGVDNRELGRRLVETLARDGFKVSR